MELINQRIEFNTEKRQVYLIVEKDEKVIAKFVYDEEENNYTVSESYKLAWGCKDTPEDNERYKGILEANVFLCKSILNGKNNL